MTRTTLLLCAGLSALAFTSFDGRTAGHWTLGTPEFSSIGELTFSPEGVLFISDPLASAVVALKTESEGAVSDGRAHRGSVGGVRPVAG